MTTITEDTYAVRDSVRVELTWIGEGVSGDYDADDRNDRPLMRFYVQKWDEAMKIWEDIDDASYCTQIDARVSKDTMQNRAQKILDRVYDSVTEGESIKKVCEELSWIEARCI